jgi:hypothetical protein
MSLDTDRYEVVRGTGEQGPFAELWDRARAPGGLALEFRQSEDGHFTLTGYTIDIPWSAAHNFLIEALSYARLGSAGALPEEPDYYRTFCNALLGLIDDAETANYDQDGLAHLREASEYFQSDWRTIHQSHRETGEDSSG